MKKTRLLSNWNRRLWNKLKSPMQAQSKIHWKVNPKEGINGNLASGLSLKSYWPPTHHPTNPPIYLMRTRLVTRPWWFSSSTRGAQLIGVILAAGQHYTRQPLEATPLWSLVNRLLDTCSHLSPVMLLRSHLVSQGWLSVCCFEALTLRHSFMKTLTNNKEDTQLHWASI